MVGADAHRRRGPRRRSARGASTLRAGRARGAARGRGDASARERGRAVLEQLLENAEIAAARRACRCARTPAPCGCGSSSAPTECLGGDLQPRVDAAVRRRVPRRRAAHERRARRAARPRRTPATTRPPSSTSRCAPGHGATVHVMLKGGGSDNASRVAMLAAVGGLRGRAATSCSRRVEAKATGACPPLVVGVGVGATFDKVGELAKKALLRADRHARRRTPRVAAFEARAARGGQRDRHRPGRARRRHDRARACTC